MDQQGSSERVTVYWRPGCPYCVMLRRKLRRRGLPTEEVDIWADPVAAAALRALAGGDETVPTVVVGGRVMVNPPATSVLEAARAAGIVFPVADGGPGRPGFPRRHA